MSAHPGNAALRGGIGLDFSLRRDADGGTIALADERLFGWLSLEGLELAVPAFALPPDDGPVAPEIFQRRRSRARAARLRMTQDDLDRYVAGLGEAMAEVGVDELRVALGDGSVAISARVREAAQVADLTLHVYLTARGDRLRLSCAHPRIHGHLDTPAPLVAHRLLSALLRANGSGRRRPAVVRGLGDFELAPLAAVLFRTLPRAGWRLPATRELPITGVRVRRGELAISYDGSAEAHFAGSEAALALTTALDRFQSADELLRHGDVDAALRAYRGELAARGPEQPFLAERILSIASARRDYFLDGIELARQVLGRWPDFAPAHAALASIAVGQGDVEAAAERYRQLAEAQTAAGDEEGALRAALAGARLLRQFAPDQSTALYEVVLSAHPGHGEAAEALADRYRDEARWHDLVKLIRMRLARGGDATLQSRDHLRLADVLFEQLGEPNAARAELLRACDLDPKSAVAFERLADIEIALGDTDAALESLATAADLHGQREDLRARARCHIRAADAIVERDPAAADALYHTALELDPGDPAAMRGAARAAAAEGRHDDAAHIWRELFSAGVEAPPASARYAYELGKSLLAAGRSTDARAPLERAAETGSAETRAEARALLAPLLRDAGDAEAAAEHLGAAIDELAALDDTAHRDRAAELAMERAVVLAALDRAADATFELRRAFDLGSPGHAARTAAARALVADGSAPEPAWLDELFAAARDPDERAGFRILRARLAFDAGRREEAMDEVDSALAEGGSDPVRRSALALKAELLAAAGDAAGRADALDAAAELADDASGRAAAAVESAEGWLAAGELERASRAAEFALEAQSGEGGAPDSARTRALTVLGECAWQRRDWKAVDRAYGQLLADAGGGVERALCAYRHGLALEKLGQSEEAEAAIRAVIADAGAPPRLVAESWGLLGDLRDRLGDLGGAAQAFEAYADVDAIELSDTARADALCRAGEIYRKGGDDTRDDAVRCFEGALRRVADHLPALDALESMARDSGDPGEVAVVLARKVAATGRHPQRQKALLVRLAALYEQELDSPDVARETYRRALALDPDYRPALAFAGRDARARGDHGEAARTFSHLTRALPGDGESPIEAAEAERARSAAAHALAEVLAAEPSAGDDDAVAALEERVASGDPGLAVALEDVYRQRGAWAKLADALGRRAATTYGAAALALDLERIEILRDRIGDPAAALAATREATERNPSAPALGVHLEALSGVASEPSSTRADTDVDAAPQLAESEALEERGDFAGAARLLESIPDPGADVLRRLAAIRLEHLGDEAGACELYGRILALEPDDLVAAELHAELLGHGGADDEAQMAALRQVLAIARRIQAGPNEEARALRQLALAARRRGDVEAASAYLEEACCLAPGELDALRERADLAVAVGDPETAARWLETLARGLQAAADDHRGGGAGDVLLELADLYDDKLDDPARARSAMRRAGDAFGPGARRDAILRLVATEAASAGAHAEAAEAYEAIGTGALSAADLLALSKLYQRLGRDQAAIDVLESARESAGLSDEAAMLLLALRRQRKRKADLAASLESGAAAAPPAVATARLLEALHLYDETLGDGASADRVREHLADVAAKEPPEAALELEAEAEAACERDGDEAAALYARAMLVHARGLAAAGSAADERLAAQLGALRALVRAASPEVPPARSQALAAGLTAAAAVEPDRAAAADLLREAANVHRLRLDDLRGAADALGRALALLPDDSALMAELDAILRELGDYSQLVAAYELHLSALSAARRASPLIELARLYRDVLGELARARAYLEDAVAADPEREAELRGELDALAADTGAADDEPEADDQAAADHELAVAAALEARGEIDAAVAHYEDAAAMVPGDLRPLRALERLHELRGDAEALVAILGRLLEQGGDRATRAALALRRGRLHLALGRGSDAYESFKDAFACAPDDGDVAHALRSLAMVRGEWALVAELIYREIHAAEGDRDRGALYFELGLIFDEKLRDRGQAIVSYEQALALDADIPAAPRPLARLYELDGRHADARRLYEQAAERAPEGAERGRLLLRAAVNAERAGDADHANLYLLAAASAEGEHKVAAEDALSRLARRTSSEPDPAAEAERAAAVDPAARLAALEQRLADAGGDPGARAALHCELGHVYQDELGDLNAAAAAFEQALAADPDHAGALDALADIAYRKSDWLRAYTLYQKLSPETSALTAGVLALRKGEISEVLGREEDACELFREAVELEPRSRDALTALSRAALRVGDLDRAIEAQQALIDLIPTERVEELRAARLKLADLCQRAGEVTHAIYYYETVLADAPKSVTALSNLVQLYAAKSDHVGASRVLRSLIALTPSPTQRADLLFRLGEIYRDAGSDPELAADAYLKAIDLDPEHEPTLRRLLDYYWRIGDRDGLIDVARDLARRDALVSTATGLRHLARIALVAVLAGDLSLARVIGDSLGEGAAEDVGRALIETCRSGADAAELANAAVALCRVAGADVGELAAWVSQRAADPAEQALAAALSAEAEAAAQATPS